MYVVLVMRRSARDAVGLARCSKELYGFKVSRRTAVRGFVVLWTFTPCPLCLYNSNSEKKIFWFSVVHAMAAPTDKGPPEPDTLAQYNKISNKPM